MPATAATIGFCTAEARIATVGPDSGVVTKYGDAARFTEEPVETYFDSMDDVAVIAADRLTLLKADRRRFQAEVSGEDVGLGLTFKPSTPVATFIDDERQASMPVAIVEFGIDLERGRTALVMWG
jgi:hypothetical protein